MSKLDKITFEVECSTVGALLHSKLNADAREIFTWLTPEMFNTAKLGVIYAAIRKQALKDNLIDVLMLESDYGQSLSELADIMQKANGSANLSGYADKLLKLYKQREAYKTFMSVAADLNALNQDEQLETVLQNGLRTLSKIVSNRSSVKPLSLSELLPTYIELVQERSQPSFQQRKLFTGIEALDEKLNGFSDTDILIIAGRPGNGKTEAAVTIAKNILEQNEPVLFFSLEMSKEQIMDRLVASASGVSSARLRNPQWLTDDDFARMGTAIQRLQDQPLYIVDKGGLTIDELISISEKHIQQHGKPKTVMIDYLGLMNHGKLDGKINRTYQIGETMKAIKDFAKKHHIPVILLSQVNRNADGSRPTNGDLRDSGSIEQDAGAIIMVHNQRDKDTQEPHRYTEFIVSKNRFGSQGTVYVEFKNGQFVECEQALAWESLQKPKAKNKQPYSKGEF